MRKPLAFRVTGLGVARIYRGVIGTCVGCLSFPLVLRKVHPLNENQYGEGSNISDLL